MATPQHSIIFWAPPVNAEPTLLVGDVVIPDDDGSGDWVIASAANRGTRGSEGVALSVTGGSGFGAVEIQSAGILDATTSGLAAGAKQLVRVSTTGRIERIASYTSGDDVIGHAEADGRVHLHFGLPWGEIAALAGGGSFTAGGDLSGTDSDQTVESIQGVVITGTPSAGSVLRATAADAASWGELDLADADATTGVLPVANGGTGLSAVGTANQVLATNAGATGLEWQTVASGGAPGGSDNQFQYNNGGAFGGAAGLTYNEGFSTPVVPNGIYFDNAANLMLLDGAPTGSRSLTLPDATDTLVGKATSDVFTNKTYSLSGTGNVLTDTSIAQYDLVMANATPAFKRFAKGSNSRALVTSSGGVVQWAQIDLTAMVTGTLPLGNGGTGLTAVPGSNTQVIFNDSSAYGADAGFTYDKANDRLTVTGAVRVGSATNTTGVGIPNNTGYQQMTTGAALRGVLNLDGSNVLRLGDTTNQPTIVCHYTTNFGAYNGSSYDFLITQATNITFGLPRHGQNSPYGSDGIVGITGAGKTLSAAEYSRKATIYGAATAGTFVYPASGGNDGAYIKVIAAAPWDGVFGTGVITISDGTNTLVLTRDAVYRQYMCTPTGWVLIG